MAMLNKKKARGAALAPEDPDFDDPKGAAKNKVFDADMMNLGLSSDAESEQK